MADKWPLANGNWSNAANWNDGTKPVVGDTVYADGKTVTIDESITVATLTTETRSGGTGGGGFVLTTGFTVTANLVAGSTSNSTVITKSAIGNSAIIGDVTGGPGSNSVGAVHSASSGTLTITGNVVGGSYNLSHGVSQTGQGITAILGNVSASPLVAAVGNPAGVHNASTGTITITGHCLGGANTNYVVQNASTGTVSIVGNVTATQCLAIYNSGSGTVQIVGNVIGGTTTNAQGVYNQAAGQVTITGTVTAGSGSGAHGAINLSTGRIDVTGLAVGNEFGVGSAGISIAFGLYNTNQAGIITVSGGQYGTRGASWSYGTVFVANRDAATVAVVEEDLDTRTLVSPLAANNPPAPSDVRNGVAYTTGGSLIGTCHVPAAASVLFGVPVDATVGTATIDAASIRAAVGLAAANLDTQLTQPFNTNANITSINNSTSLLTKFAASLDQIIVDSVSDSEFTPTTIYFESATITEATLDHYKGRVIIFTSGNLAKQATIIEGYELFNTYGRFKVQALTEVPANGDSFIII